MRDRWERFLQAEGAKMKDKRSILLAVAQIVADGGVSRNYEVCHPEWADVIGAVACLVAAGMRPADAVDTVLREDHQEWSSHSAKIDLWLEIDGSIHELTHTGPDFVHLRTPVDLPPSDATLVVRINGNPIVKQVRLPNGATVASSRCEIIETE